MDELKPPKNIYLQNYFEDFGFYDEGATWCTDKQNDNDIEYILQSEYTALRAQLEQYRWIPVTERLPERRKNVLIPLWFYGDKNNLNIHMANFDPTTDSWILKHGPTGAIHIEDENAPDRWMFTGSLLGYPYD